MAWCLIKSSYKFMSTYVPTCFSFPKTIKKSRYTEAESLKCRKFEFRWSIMTGLILYLHAAWRKVLLEKLTVSQLVKKFTAFYVTRRFTTMSTSARHLSLSWARSIQSMPPHSTVWRSILILSSHLKLGLSSGYFPQVSPPKLCVHLSSSPNVLHDPAISIFCIWSPEKYLVRSTKYRSLSSLVCSFLHYPVTFPLSLIPHALIIDLLTNGVSCWNQHETSNKLTKLLKILLI
jgi:hypothetical protein